MKRRSFFKSLARAAAIVALAPQIAFGIKPEWKHCTYGLDVGDKSFTVAFWYQTSRRTACIDAEYVKALARLLPEKFHVDGTRLLGS